MNMAYAFDVHFIKRFYQLHAILFPGLVSYTFFLFCVLFAVAVGEQFLVYRVSDESVSDRRLLSLLMPQSPQVGLISGEFYKVLGQKDVIGFRNATLKAIGVILAMTVVKSFRMFINRSMQVGWRLNVNKALHRMYFMGIRYYLINVLDEGQLDNPDQRLTADIQLLVTKYGSIITDLILAPLLVSYYSYSAFTRSGWVGPVGMFVLFLVSTVINKLLMSPIVNLTVKKEQREGDFRFKHVSVRTNAESLGFHDTAQVEAVRADHRLEHLCQVQQRLYQRQLLLDLATNTFDYLGSIASFLVISVAIFGGVYDDLDGPELAKVISENAFVCMYLIYQFSKLVDMSGTVSSMAGATHRIMELAECLAVLPKDYPDQDDKDNQDDALSSTDVILELKNVSISAPESSRMLVSNLNLEVIKGRHLIIVGRSSAGKSSIFRVIRGLWSPVQGQVFKRDRIKIFFLPQKPFFTDGSIKDQVIYPLLSVPGVSDPEQDEWLEHLLEELGLGDLVHRCGGLDTDPRWRWYDVLSPGEMQRLAFVRLFYHRPALAFLDEATSALSPDIEELLYQRCLDLNITLVSVGHRDGLKQFHHQILTIGLDEGAWDLQTLKQME